MTKKKRDLKRGEISSLYKVHLNFAESSFILKKVCQTIQKDINKGYIRGSVKEKMDAFLILTNEVDKTISAYDSILKEYFNIGGDTDDKKSD